MVILVASFSNSLHSDLDKAMFTAMTIGGGFGGPVRWDVDAAVLMEAGGRSFDDGCAKHDGGEMKSTTKTAPTMLNRKGTDHNDLNCSRMHVADENPSIEMLKCLLL